MVQLLLTLPDLIALAAGFSVFLTATAAAGRLRSIHGVSRPTWGAQLLPAGLLAAALLGRGWGHPAASAFGMLVLAIADPLAALVGSRIHSLSWRVPGARKSLAGSAAFLLAASDQGFLLTLAAGSLRGPGVAAAAVALTAVEACTGFGLENLLLPVAGTLAGRAWLDL